MSGPGAPRRHRMARPAAVDGSSPYPVRLQRFLARAGVTSRRRAQALIEAGRVMVNGQPVTALETVVDPAQDSVSLDGQRVEPGAAVLYLALHKPPGFITTHRDPDGRPTVMDLLPPFPGLLFVGRLDADSEGLLLATTDGGWSQRLQHPRYGCEKGYHVCVRGEVTAASVGRLRQPLDLGEGDWSSGAQVMVRERSADGAELGIVLREGRKRQIRRMCARVGLTVVRLVRVRVGPVHLGDLPTGRWRPLADDEVQAAATVKTTP